MITFYSWCCFIAKTSQSVVAHRSHILDVSNASNSTNEIFVTLYVTFANSLFLCLRFLPFRKKSADAGLVINFLSLFLQLFWLGTVLFTENPQNILMFIFFCNFKLYVEFSIYFSVLKQTGILFASFTQVLSHTIAAHPPNTRGKCIHQRCCI